MREEAVGLQSTIKANQDKKNLNTKGALTSPKGSTVLAALISGRAATGGNYAKRMASGETAASPTVEVNHTN